MSNVLVTISQKKTEALQNNKGEAVVQKFKEEQSKNFIV